MDERMTYVCTALREKPNANGGASLSAFVGRWIMEKHASSDNWRDVLLWAANLPLAGAVYLVVWQEEP